MKTLAMLAVVVFGCVAAVAAYDYGTGGGIGVLPHEWTEAPVAEPTTTSSCSSCVTRSSCCSQSSCCTESAPVSCCTDEGAGAKCTESATEAKEDE